ncbi:excisionase family DNA-binding protein [Actinopolymorpha alba]|uniref:excisionase family DNA-binding protein n=1 Tax=Actinopolymorpha alba TaxID=533267 RepID=UPI0009FE76CC|nr:excisionase family DNA-binding protein [Actinopolymorpha alba]
MENSCLEAIGHHRQHGSAETQVNPANTLTQDTPATVTEVAGMLGFGLSKTKMLVASGEIRSIKDGRHRRILPQWIDEYVARRLG